MSHHASGPNFGFPRRDARLDMTDLYAFTKPGDPAIWARRADFAKGLSPMESRSASSGFRHGGPSLLNRIEQVAPKGLIRISNQCANVGKKKRPSSSQAVVVFPDSLRTETKTKKCEAERKVVCRIGILN